MNKYNESVEPFSLNALRQGDRVEFARLVETYSGMIFHLALKMLENPQDAEDVLQETFIKAYGGIKNFDGRSKLSTWIYRIATNEALMLLRKSKRIINSIDEPLEEDGELEVPLQIVDWCCLPEEELMTSEARAYLNKAVEILPASLRVVFILRDLEGLSTQETSEVLELSETAVKTRLSRARFRLREELTSYFSETATRRQVSEERGA